MKSPSLLRAVVFFGTFLGSLWAGSKFDLPFLSYFSPIGALGAVAAIELLFASRRGDRHQISGIMRVALLLLPLLVVALDQSVKYLALPHTFGNFGYIESVRHFLPNFESDEVTDIDRNFAFLSTAVFGFLFVLFALIYGNWMILVAVALILGGGMSNGLDFLIYGKAVVINRVGDLGMNFSTNLADISVYAGLILFLAGMAAEFRKTRSNRNLESV